MCMHVATRAVSSILVWRMMISSLRVGHFSLHLPNGQYKKLESNMITVGGVVDVDLGQQQSVKAGQRPQIIL